MTTRFAAAIVMVGVGAVSMALRHADVATGAGQESGDPQIAALSGPGQWVNIGPSPVGYEQNPGDLQSGRVSSIAVNPQDERHWLLGVGNGGVWESRDAGDSWRPVTDSAPTLAIGAIAFAPSNPGVIYVGTGESAGVSHAKVGLGLLKSTNGGNSWRLIAASKFARATVKRIRVHPTNPNVLVAATARGGVGRDAQPAAPSAPPQGVLRSSDGGNTWTRSLAGQGTALEVDARNFNQLYAAIGDQRVGVRSFTDSPGSVNGVYRSTDGAKTWTLIKGPWGNSSATKSSVGRIELAISPSNPDVLYASFQIPPNGGASNTALRGLYRTNNAWAATPTWVKIPTGPTGSGGYCGPRKCGYTHVLSVDPTDANTLFVGGAYDGPWRCSNCGSSPTWTTLHGTSAPHPDHHALAWAGNRLLNGNDGGVWSSIDRGQSWQNHNRGLSTLLFQSGALHPTDSSFILGGIRDFTGVYRRGSAWLIFTRAAGWEGGEAEVAVSSSRPDTDWMVGRIHGIVQRTTDGGKSGSKADNGIDKTGSAFVAPVRKCPNDDDVFLTGTNRLWRTNNFFSSPAPSWKANSPRHPFQFPGSPFAPGTILSIAFVPQEAGCATYAYGNRGGEIRLTRDGGKTWADLDKSRTLPARPVNGLAFDPTNSQTLYAALSSFNSGTPGKPGHVFKTTNAQAAAPKWTNVSPNSDQPFNVIAVDPTNPLLIYAGSDTGLWRSHNGAKTWVRVGLGNGVPSASVHNIQINATTGTTIVFTFGRGAYQLAAGS